MSFLSNKGSGNPRRKQYKIILTAFLAAFLLCCYLAVTFALNDQKNAVRENAVAYAGIMDEHISVDLQSFMELNLDRSEESAMADFFYHKYNDKSAAFLNEVRADLLESVQMLQNLEELILYRSFDNTLLSTLNDHYLLTKLNPAYSYLMDSVAQAGGDTPAFVYSAGGSVLYYFPVSALKSDDFPEESERREQGQVKDCVIAILHKSEGFLNAELPMASSLSTFAVLKEGQVLSTEGYNPLSQKLVATISEIARTDSSVYTYEDLNLPNYYFYNVSSQVSELNYTYYEPALTGWALIRKAVISPWGILLLLLSAGLLVSGFLLLASAEGPAGNRVVEITMPYESAEAFGSQPYFSGIIIDYHNINGSAISPEILELFDRIICENLSVNKIFYQFSSQRNSDCLQYYMNYSNYNLRVLCDSLKMNLYNAAPDYAINIFYSGAVSSYQEMESELLYLHRNLRYSLVLGYGRRLSISQIKEFEASTAKMDVNVAGTIQNHLRTRAYEDLYSYLKQYRDTMTHLAGPESTVYSFAEMYRFAEEAFGAVKMFFLENSYSHDMVQISCSTVLRTTPGFGNFCDYLISCIQDYQQENQHVLSTRNEQIMNSIYTYIEQDLAGANLNSIARKMQMTDSHLSRVFKKNTGTNFSEYLSVRKLEEAARLLVQDNKIKVADIADMLGYGNPTYFLSRFKAKYGVSPSAYRKAHILSETAGNPAASSKNEPSAKDESFSKDEPC